MSFNRRNPTRTTSKIDPNTQLTTSRNSVDPNEAARERFLQLRALQTRIMYGVWAFSAIAIGLYFAKQILLAQLAVLLATIALIALCWVSWQRYKLNRERREEILAQMDLMQDDQLRALFNEARRAKGLPPDESDTTGYTAQMKRERARIAEKTGRPDRVQRFQAKNNPDANNRGPNDGGRQR